MSLLPVLQSGISPKVYLFLYEQGGECEKVINF